MRRADEVPFAEIATTPQEVARLLAERPHYWPWAVFASVLCQRMSAMEQRRISVAVGRRGKTSSRMRDDRQVALWVGQCLRSCDDMVAERETFLHSARFIGVFGYGDDTADSEGLMWAADRLIDIYDRHLGLAESVRDSVAPQQHADLIRDCALFTYAPIRDFKDFARTVVERFENMRDRMAAGAEEVNWDPLPTITTTHDTLIWSIMDRLNEIR